MVGKNVFVPNILLCGDEVEFASRIGERPYKIVGHVQFTGKVDGGGDYDFTKDGKFLLNDKLCAGEELTKIIKSGDVDFIVFNYSGTKLLRLDKTLKDLGCSRGYGISTTEFKSLPTDNIHYLQTELSLMRLLKRLSIKTLLDVDGYFAKSLMCTKNPNETTEIDCIYDGDFFPLKSEFFRHVYKDFSECSLRHYDAALISENTPADFDKAFNLLKNTADLVITFTRNNSEFAKHIQSAKDKFKKVEVYNCTPTGQWIFCYRQTPPQDFTMYVVTHKRLPPEFVKTFPVKYTIINAGAATRDDLGYLRDDTGDNISELNPYINELTAHYWAWKNTSHDMVGFCHYRRFFNLEKDVFLTETQALELLKNYDLLIRDINSNRGSFSEEGNSNQNQVKEIIRKNLERTHPDYLDAFDYKMHSSPIYFNSSFIARKNVFDAYCEWLFSFIIVSLKEILDKKRLVKDTRRVGYFCEAMGTVWLMKNHLRVKDRSYIVKDPFKV